VNAEQASKRAMQEPTQLDLGEGRRSDWEKYRGPYTTLSVDEYAAMTKCGSACIGASTASRSRLLSGSYT
jgi:hypothetical protein